MDDISFSGGQWFSPRVEYTIEVRDNGNFVTEIEARVQKIGDVYKVKYEGDLHEVRGQKKPYIDLAFAKKKKKRKR